MHQAKPKKVRDKIGNLVKHLAESDFYQIDFKPCINKCLEGLKPRQIDQIICYGLGSFHDGVEVTSRYQLALLLLLHSHLLECGSPLKPVIEIYDPLFDQSDKEILLSYRGPKFHLIGENEHCARKLDITQTTEPDRCTLVYMPHLDKYLYNNLLGINWCNSNLRRLVILGNSFREMVDSEIALEVNLDIHYIHQLVINFDSDTKPVGKKNRHGNLMDSTRKLANEQKALIEIPLDCGSFEHSDIFNSLALHYINDAWLQNNLQMFEKCKLADWNPITSCQQE